MLRLPVALLSQLCHRQSQGVLHRVLFYVYRKEQNLIDGIIVVHGSRRIVLETYHDSASEFLRGELQTGVGRPLPDASGGTCQGKM